MEDGRSWDAGIQQLLQEGIISGYALISKHGSTQAAEGVLSKADARGSQSDNSAAGKDDHMQLQQFAKAFPNSSAAPMTFWLAGQKAVVFRRTDCDILGISHKRKLGLCIHALPFGILVCTYSRARLPQEVIPKVLRICDMLRM